MKVVYIRSSNIYDDSRATKEIIALAQSGYSVHVLGWDRDGKAMEQSLKVFSQYSDSVSFSFYSCGIKGGIGLKNIDKLFKWIHWTNQIVKKQCNVNFIHACNLDAALGVWRYAKNNRIKLVYDIYDYYVDSHMIPLGLRALVEYFEIKIINAADATIICTDDRKEQVAKATPRKLTVIHNSPDVMMVENEVNESYYDYVYCGALFDYRLIKEIFSEYHRHNTLKFAVAGYGDYSELAQKLSEENKEFTYLGSIPYNEVLRVESKSKVISAIYEPTRRNHRLCAPNKFYEALALAKPVIVCKGTGIDKIVESNKIGIVIEYNARQFFDAIESLVNNPVLCKKMGKEAKKLYDTEYNWTKMKTRLIQLYDNLDDN